MNKSEYFIAIIPPKEYTEKIIQFQKLWKNNSLPYTVEPHITLKSQAGLENKMNWLDQVKAICKSFSSFKLTISGVKTFGTSVVYLSIISAEIYELHRKIVGAVAPDPELSKRYFELDLYEPHLTLGLSEFGMSYDELIDMKEQAKRQLNSFPLFIVKRVRLLRLENSRYRKIEDKELKQI